MGSRNKRTIMKPHMDRFNVNRDVPLPVRDESKAESEPVMDEPTTVTPWQEGYMYGVTKDGDLLECPYTMDSKKANDWTLGFFAGRADLREGV